MPEAAELQGIDADLQHAYAPLKAHWDYPNWPHERCGDESIGRRHDRLLDLQQTMREAARKACFGDREALMQVFTKVAEIFIRTPGLQTDISMASLQKLLNKLPPQLHAVVEHEWPMFLKNPLQHRCFENGASVHMPCALIVPANFRTHDSDFGAMVCNALKQEPYFVFNVQVHDDLGHMPYINEQLLDPGRRFATLDEAACIFAVHPMLGSTRGLAQEKDRDRPYAGQVYFAGENWEYSRTNAVWNRPVQGELMSDSNKYEKSYGTQTRFPQFHHIVTVQDFSAAGASSKRLPALERRL